MVPALPLIHLVRHGETAWTQTRQHTGLTDIPLTERGRHDAQRLGERLRGNTAAHVFTSPLQRARTTCDLAGFGANATVDPDLVEWDYGDYEGLTTTEIRQRAPGWQLFRDGCPGGEAAADVGRRADRFLVRLSRLEGDSLVFSSGHFLRVLTARWLGLDASQARLFLLSTTTLSVLGYEHDRTDPVIRLWNDARPGDD